VTVDLVSVRLGEHKISTVEDCDLNGFCAEPVQDINVAKSFKHEKYDRFKRINDIAVLKLATKADLTRANVKTICLPTTAEQQIDRITETARDKMAIAGWGKIGNNVVEQSDVLMKAFVPFVPLETCAEKVLPARFTIYNTQICAGGSAKKIDTCNGESLKPQLMEFSLI